MVLFVCVFVLGLCRCGILALHSAAALLRNGIDCLRICNIWWGVVYVVTFDLLHFTRFACFARVQTLLAYGLYIHEYVVRS